MVQTDGRCVYLLKYGIVQVITKGLRVQVEEEASADTKVGSHGKEAFQRNFTLMKTEKHGSKPTKWHQNGKCHHTDYLHSIHGMVLT